MTEPTEALELLREIYADLVQGAIPNADDPWWQKASAVLAGTPAPVGAGEVVAWVDERAIGWLKNSRAHSATITTTLGKAKSYERPMPLHGTPQSTQPQAGAVPMTPEQRDALWESCKYDDGEEWTVDWEQIVDAVERHHRIGIKGGQYVV